MVSIYQDSDPFFQNENILNNTHLFIICYIFFFSEINVCWLGFILKQQLYSENILQKGYFSEMNQSGPSENLNLSNQSES